MAITISELTSAYDNSDATGYTTASISPAANSLLVVFWSTRENTTAPAITVSGGGLTWVESEPEQVDGISAIGSWYAQCGGSPGSFTLSLSCDGGVTAIGCAWAVLQVAGHDTSTPIVQSPIAGTGSTGTTATVTFASLAGSSNAQLLHAIHRANEAQSAEAGWTAGTARNGSGPNYSSLATWKIASADLSATQTWTTSARWQAQGLEIQAAGGSVTGSAAVTLQGVTSQGQGAPAPEAVLFVACSSPNGATGTTSLTPLWPAGYTPTADDIGLMCINQNNSNSTVTITGSTWTLLLRTQRNTTHVQHLYRRKLTGSGDTPTVGFGATSGAQVFLTAWRNVDLTTPEDVTTVGTTGTLDFLFTGPDIGALTTPGTAIVTFASVDNLSQPEGLFLSPMPDIVPFPALQGISGEQAGAASRMLGTAIAYHHQMIPSQTNLRRTHTFVPSDNLASPAGWIGTTVALRPANPTVVPVANGFTGAVAQAPFQTAGVEGSASDPYNTALAVEVLDPYGAGGGLWSSGGSDGAFWDVGTWGGAGRWTDISSRVRGLEWRVGADQPGGRPRIGTASIELDNADALVSPWAAAGPFTDGVSSWLRTGCLLRLTISNTNLAGTVGYGTTIYTGEIESVDEGSTATADAWVVLHLQEPLSRLARWNSLEQGQQGAHDSLFERVQRLLDGTDWLYGWAYHPTAGHVPSHALSATYQTTTLAGERLAELYLTGDSAGVNIYSQTDGSILVNNPLDAAATLTFSNAASGGELPLADITRYANNARLLNVAIGSRRTALPTDALPDPPATHAIEIGNGPSISRFGRIDTGNGWPRLDLICESDSTVSAILNAVLAFRAADDQGIGSLELDADQQPATLYNALATLRLFDVVDVRYVHPVASAFSQTQHSYVEAMAHRVTREGPALKWTATLELGKFPS